MRAGDNNGILAQRLGSAVHKFVGGINRGRDIGFTVEYVLSGIEQCFRAAAGHHIDVVDILLGLNGFGGCHDLINVLLFHVR